MENIIVSDIISTDSTQKEVLNFVKKNGLENCCDGKIVALRAEIQTSGRGQRANVWESEPGKNILASLYLEPALAPEAQFAISQITALAVREFVAQYCDAVVSIKWPNDIYVEGRKIAGILIEHSLQGSMIHHSIVGVGINVNQWLFSEHLPNATSLLNETALEYDLSAAFDAFLAIFAVYFAKINDKDFLAESYLQYLYKRAEEVVFVYKGARSSGVIEGVDPFGQLMIKRERGSFFVNNSQDFKLVL